MAFTKSSSNYVVKKLNHANLTITIGNEFMLHYGSALKKRYVVLVKKKIKSI